MSPRLVEQFRRPRELHRGPRYDEGEIEELVERRVSERLEHIERERRLREIEEQLAWESIQLEEIQAEEEIQATGPTGNRNKMARQRSSEEPREELTSKATTEKAEGLLAQLKP